MKKKTVIYTTFYVKNPSYETLIWEWLISLRTLGNYQGEVIIFDYGMPQSLIDKLLNFSLGAPKIIHIENPADSINISNWRNIDVIPHLEKYKDYMFAHFDADVWFQNDVNLLWEELENVEGCYHGIEIGRTCRYRGPEDELVKQDYYKIQDKLLKGFVFGGWIAGKYTPYLNKLNQMKDLWDTTWSIDEWGTDQCMITYLYDFKIDNPNGIKYGCSWYYCDVKNKLMIKTKDPNYPFEEEEAIGVHIIAFNSIGTDKEEQYFKYRFKYRYPELWKKHQ